MTRVQNIAKASPIYHSTQLMTRILLSPASRVSQSAFQEKHRIPSAHQATGLRQAASTFIACKNFTESANKYNSLIPDALHMAPLRVGDYIEYSGVQWNGETICYAIVANIDIRTSGNQPGYIRVEDAIVGVADTGADVEAARHRVS
jgi:hypothetical protein